ncbi:ferric reduction oxidase 2-like [Dioscorea cayenensis subsp. rotundata]|uniref:ferric-chelate reductase (NADH) n=1 Tax=Dioscorea cayennensis subsp. rotundata TaxID=55577 RepID=A0AB40CLG7_DIOCR|nr:ferric reduction oxidase 2-like [Dioscorea cayenensis subsp. rotundata]
MAVKGSSSSYYASMVVFLLVLKLVMSLVFISWLLVWILLPTKPFDKWSDKFYTATNSTYFGSQGTNILIYTFPILLISLLGCIYLHFAKRLECCNSLSSFLRTWTRPVLVKAPLGIISLMELAFCLMFLAFLIWFFTAAVHNSFSSITKESAETEGYDQVWMQKLYYASVWLALTGNTCCAFLFFPVTRTSSLLPLIGLTSESSIRYHVWLGHIAMLFFTAHGICFVVLWAAMGDLWQLLKWDFHEISNVAGEIALICGLLMWVTTFPTIRRKMFELFFYTHQLYFLFLLFYLLHLGIRVFTLILPGVYLFLLDRYLRFLQSRRKARLVSARLLHSETLELNFSKHLGSSYTPLSTVFINVPSVSSLQWHPFTISSSSNLEPEKLSIIIKKEGSWTQRLYQMLSSPSCPQRLDISVEGPYGPVSLNFLRYDSLVLVSGGSGITPFISVIRELIYRSTTLASPTPNILLVCAFKTSADLSMLDLLLPISSTISDLSSLNLKIEAFVTREKAPPTPNNAAKLKIRTKWFKPLPSDQPISLVLGPNTWLWLATIITTSFVAFLVLLGILTNYYIYPIDKNTDEIYNISWRALLNLLFICFCIVATASAAVFWEERRSSIQLKQSSNMDVKTPIASPTSWLDNVDQELESLPLDSVLQTANVHYGGRPDLTKMLLECNELNTGVMASGPSELRHQVARVCSSGLANNLHFESISFNW